MNISIIIPVYLHTAVLTQLVHRIFAVCDGCHYHAAIYLIDDGSPNEAWQQLIHLKQELTDQPITLIRLADNAGQQAATLCGLLYAKGDYLVTMDADLQHPPEAIPSMLTQLLDENLDVVYAKATHWPSPWRRYTSLGYRRLVHPIGKPFIQGSSYRVLRAAFIRKLLKDTHQPFYFLDTLLKSSTANIKSSSIDYTQSAYPNSTYSFVMLAAEALKNIAYSFIGFRIILKAKKTTRPQFTIAEVVS